MCRPLNVTPVVRSEAAQSMPSTNWSLTEESPRCWIRGFHRADCLAEISALDTIPDYVETGLRSRS